MGIKSKIAETEARLESLAEEYALDTAAAYAAAGNCGCT